MQKIFFSIGDLLESSFQVLVVLGWLPVISFSVIMFLGFLYWLKLQADYNRKAREKGTLA